MAFKSSDGSQFTNHSGMKSHEARIKAKSPQPAPQPEPDADDMGGEDPQSVASAHGPAVEVNISHDHQGGKHSVHSMHQDGHEHTSEHGSADEAHQAARVLSGDGGY